MSNKFNKHAKTPWFEWWRKPARPGVYEVQLGDPDTEKFAHYDGQRWGWWADTPKKAASQKVRTAAGAFQRKTWRGLVTQMQ